MLMANSRGNYLPMHALNERQRSIAAQLADGQSIEEVAERNKVKTRTIRSLFRQPLFRAELAQIRDNLRALAQPEAVKTVIGKMRDPGDGSTAASRLQMDAACRILGDDAKAPIVNVSVATQVNVAQARGYAFKPCDRIIDGKPNE